MWFCFFDLETSLAAEFWILCSFVKSLSGTPYRRLLQLSKRDVTNAWTRISVVALFRNERILPIRLSAREALRQMMLMCSRIVKCLSMTMPKSRTEVDGLTWALYKYKIIIIVLDTVFVVSALFRAF